MRSARRLSQLARAIVSVIVLLANGAAGAQAVATSAGPDAVSVTVYRDPKRALDQAFDLRWLNGYALVTERRRMVIPAGEGELRFEGVAAGIIPQSAVIAGIPQEIVERNRDAMLLSPGSLLDASLGRRVRIRRTSPATGEVTRIDAVIRSGDDGAVILETRQGVESLRCTGLPETLLYRSVPPGLSARPTLSVRTRSTRRIAADVTLSYLATGFDWRADYILELAPDGRSMDLFAWLTLANGDETGFKQAQAQAVAGRLNRAEEDVEEPDAPPLRLQCWPQGSTTSDLREIEVIRPASPPSLRRRYSTVSESVSAMSVAPLTMIAARLEDLGDAKLYRIPEPVTIAARSQKQVALLHRPRVSLETVYRFTARRNAGEEGAVPVLKTRNRSETGLGIPLPGGPVDVYERTGGRALLAARGAMRDIAVGEPLSIPLRPSEQVIVRTVVERETGGLATFLLTVTNRRSSPIPFEVELPDWATGELIGKERFPLADGVRLWSVTVGARGSAELRYEVRNRP
ncbi:hypothetical protein E2493_10520 [Sphingomonas parva]|uniref:DUF4139 domain-containing protein n=1 Tax=Sphingomonas parva TaxID=2555898 RepID=A0A4Y8ZQC1_9SPHN|nr:hypothetical protein [Sphingomonas parva]TFI58220.1 hypothetical protein E2493_10520 [Sphingomonas parva]